MTTYVSDHKWAGAPQLPTDRPPTRAEVWAYVRYWYEGIKTEDEMKAHAKECWVGNYVRWVNLHGWRMPPDWVEGQPHPPDHIGRPKGPITPDGMTATVYALLEAR